MENEGSYPLDPETPVGELRLLTGDSVGTPGTGEHAGKAAYRYWSDAELRVFLKLNGGSVYLGAAAAYTQLAATIGLQPKSGRTWRTEDLGLSGNGPEGDIRLVAREWRYLAEQAAEDDADSFIVIPGPSLIA